MAWCTNLAKVFSIDFDLSLHSVLWYGVVELVNRLSSVAKVIDVLCLDLMPEARFKTCCVGV